MADYRIYLLDCEGSILTASNVDCSDDTRALAAARELSQSFAQAEIWQGKRLLGRVSPVQR